MNRLAVAAVCGALLSTGCATGARAYMDAPLSDHSEPASVWNRPQEVGFDFGEEATGEAMRQCVLGFICWGTEGGGTLDGFIAAMSAILGHPSTVDDPLVRAAAAIAVSNTAKADGIFVVAHDTDSLNVIVYSRRIAHVRGKTFSLRKIGEVSQERADKLRNLNALGGRALIQMSP